MHANMITASGRRDSVSRLGMVNKLSRRGSGMAKSPALPGGTDRPAGKIVTVGCRHLDANEIAGAQVLRFHTHDAVDLRSIGMAAGQIMAGNFGVRAVDNRVDLAPDLPSAPGER